MPFANNAGRHAGLQKHTNPHEGSDHHGHTKSAAQNSHGHFTETQPDKDENTQTHIQYTHACTHAQRERNPPLWTCTCQNKRRHIHSRADLYACIKRVTQNCTLTHTQLTIPRRHLWRFINRSGQEGRKSALLKGLMTSTVARSRHD